jgi:hypothetical protein
MKSVHLLSSEWWSPHKETDLELIQESINCGNEVIVVGCSGVLDACYINPKHSWLDCVRCVGMKNAGLSYLIGKYTYVELLDKRFESNGYIELRDLPNNLKSFLMLKDGQLDIGYAVGTYLVDVTRDSSLNPSEQKDLVTKLLIATSRSYRWFLNFFSAEKPDIIYAMNGRHLQYRSILQAALDLGLDIRMHERGGEKNKYMLYPRCLPHDRGYFRQLVKNARLEMTEEFIEKEGGKFFTDKVAGKDNNWFSYVTEQEVDRLPPDFHSYSRKTSFFLCSDFECAAVSQEWDWYVYPDQITGIQMICAEMAQKCPEMHFFIRMHPNMKNDKATPRISSVVSNIKNATLIPPDSSISSYGLMMRSDCVLTFGSTIGIEACFWGKPSVLICPAMYEDFDVAINCHSHSEVIRALLDPGHAKNKKEAMLYGAIMATMGNDFKHVVMENPFKGTFNGKVVTNVTEPWRRVTLKMASFFN